MTCPACKEHGVERGKYLCRGCWFTLPKATRTALNRRDDLASARLLALHRALRQNVPLRKISIA